MRKSQYFPFECSVLNKGTTGTIFITSLVWRGPWLGIEPGPPALEASTLPLGYREGGKKNEWWEYHYTKWDQLKSYLKALNATILNVCTWVGILVKAGHWLGKRVWLWIKCKQKLSLCVYILHLILTACWLTHSQCL